MIERRPLPRDGCWLFFFFFLLLWIVCVLECFIRLKHLIAYILSLLFCSHSICGDRAKIKKQTATTTKINFISNLISFQMPRKSSHSVVLLIESKTVLSCANANLARRLPIRFSFHFNISVNDVSSSVVVVARPLGLKHHTISHEIYQYQYVITTRTTFPVRAK